MQPQPGSRNSLDKVIDIERNPIGDPLFLTDCVSALRDYGVLLLPGFLTQGAIKQIVSDGKKHRCLAYNTEPGVSLSESARMTFYGRLG